MNNDQAKECLARFFEAFPMYLSWFNKQKNREQTAAVWVRVVAMHHEEDVIATIDGMIEGSIELPEGYEMDRLPQKIAAECRLRNEHRAKIRRRELLHLQATEGKERKPMARLPMATDHARACGVLLAHGKITREQNSDYLRELIRWCECEFDKLPPLPTTSDEGNDEL